MSSDFHFRVPEAFMQNLIDIGTVVSEKIQFEFFYVHHLRPRSRNDLDLHYLHNLSSYILKNPLFSLFPTEKPKLPNLTLP